MQFCKFTEYTLCLIAYVYTPTLSTTLSRIMESVGIIQEFKNEYKKSPCGANHMGITLANSLAVKQIKLT